MFNNNFYWGSATSSFQIEGGIINNWTVHGFNKGKASNHYELYKDDIKIMKSLNLSSYRFSLEWSRIEPRSGEFDQNAILYYNNLINTLKENNIEPFITIFHFTLPVWFPGWEYKNGVYYFYRYANKLFQSFPQVKYWITINEPIIYSLVSYLLGEWPPMKRNPRLFYKVIKNLKKAHCQVYKLAGFYKCIGFAKNLMYFRKISFGLGFIKKIWNEWWFKLVKNHYDFIGVNYYLPLDLKWSSLFKANTNYFKNIPITNKVSDLGWEICPEGLYHILKELKKYGAPIIITENGIADNNDSRRASYIRSHINELKKCKSNGIDIKGYFYWSLLDNYEWGKGFEPRFGLVEVDYKNNFKRTIRESAYYYRDLIKNGI